MLAPVAGWGGSGRKEGLRFHRQERGFQILLEGRLGHCRWSPCRCHLQQSMCWVWAGGALFAQGCGLASLAGVPGFSVANAGSVAAGRTSVDTGREFENPTASGAAERVR